MSQFRAHFFNLSWYDYTCHTVQSIMQLYKVCNMYIYGTLRHEALCGISVCKYNYSRSKNNCRKTQPAHSMITKRDCISRGSCFCEKNIFHNYHCIGDRETEIYRH